MFSRVEAMMDDKAQENINLFNELVEFSERDIPPEVSAAAARQRARIRPECLKPYDLLRYSTLEGLPPAIASPVAACFRCRTLLLPRFDPVLVAHAVDEAATAAAAAIAKNSVSKHWYE